MFNLTFVFESLFDTFELAIKWLFEHGITIGDFSITFGDLSIAFFVISLVLSFLPDYDESEE